MSDRYYEQTVGYLTPVASQPPKEPAGGLALSSLLLDMCAWHYPTGVCGQGEKKINVIRGDDRRSWHLR